MFFCALLVIWAQKKWSNDDDEEGALILATAQCVAINVGYQRPISGTKQLWGQTNTIIVAIIINVIIISVIIIRMNTVYWTVSSSSPPPLSYFSEHFCNLFQILDTTNGIFLLHLGDPPPLKIWQNSLCWYLSANLSGGYLFHNKTVSFVSGGPYGPKGEPPLVFIIVFILVFICQHFERVLIL